MNIKEKIWFYLILYPFFQPLGLNAIGLKTFFNVWRYLTLLIVFFVIIIDLYNKTKVVNRKSIKKCLFEAKNETPKLSLVIMEYQIIMFIITIVLQRGITEGYQKIFCVMGLIVALTYYAKYTEDIIEICMKIIDFNLILNIVMLNSKINGITFSVNNHEVLQGHVQVFPMIYICSIGLISLRFYKIKKIRSLDWITLGLSILSGFLTGRKLFFITFIASVFLLFVYIYFIKMSRYSYNLYLVIWTIGNVIIWILSYNGFFDFLGISMHGRTFIWNEAIRHWKKSRIVGYGAYGIGMHVFWLKSGIKMNYAHSELLQKLIDGGLILNVLFIRIFYYIGKYIDLKNESLDKKRELLYIKIVFILWMIAMITESVTEYNYFWINTILFANIMSENNIVMKKI